MLPIYKIEVSERDDSTGIDFNSWVDIPAHMKTFIAFSKNKEKINFVVDNEKRIVTGVMISANTPIYRKSPVPCYVVFTAEVIETIRNKFFKNGFVQNLNDMHNQKKLIKGATLVDSYIIYNNNKNYPSAPKSMKDMNLQDGTWIASYYVHDNELWKEVKYGKWGGFSVEGYFDLKKTEIKTTKKEKMAKKEKTIFEMIFGKQNQKEKFKKAVSKDGVDYFYETGEELGETIEVGSEIYIEVDGEQIQAPEGDIELTTEEGIDILVSIDERGIVENVEVIEDTTEVAELLRKLIKDTDARFRNIEREMARQKSEKFKAHNRRTGDGPGKSNFRDLLNGKNKKK